MALAVSSYEAANTITYGLMENAGFAHSLASPS